MRPLPEDTRPLMNSLAKYLRTLEREIIIGQER
jgi:hypothetical protein